MRAAARLEIWILVNDYIAKAEQLRRPDEYLEEKVKEVPNVEKLFAIKGVGMSTVIGFIAEVGDIKEFRISMVGICGNTMLINKQKGQKVIRMLHS